MIATAKNIIKGFYKKLDQLAGNPYKKLNIGWTDLRMLKNGSGRQHYRQRFLKGYVEFYNVAEFLYGVDEIFLSGIYDFKSGNAPKIIDCGGHIGLSAMYFKEQHPDAEITVFEPDEKNFTLLQKNIASQGYKNVVLKNEAVWIETTRLTFSAEGSMSSKIAPEGASGTISVKALRLKDMLTQDYDLLKLDIEGAEYEVLKDIKDRFHLLRNIFIEYHGLFSKQNELLEILDWIKESGFSFYIKEAHEVYPHPFNRSISDKSNYDVQLNIFCFRN